MSSEHTYCDDDGSATIVVSVFQVHFVFFHKHKYLDVKLIEESLELNQNIIAGNHFSKLELNFELLFKKIISIFTDNRKELQEYLDHKIITMWNIIRETVTDPCFTSEMLNNISFSDSPVKSARKI